MYGENSPYEADKTAYLEIRNQKQRYAGEYARDNDCSTEFRAAHLPIDPGVAEEERLLRVQSSRRAVTMAYSRAIVTMNGSIWISTAGSECELSQHFETHLGQKMPAEFASTHGASDCGPPRQILRRQSKGGWIERGLGANACEAILKIDYNSHCPPSWPTR
jgi:hypothetical protein